MMATLRSYIERIEALEAEKKAIGEELAELYKDAKNEGYDTVVMKVVVKRRKMSDVERRTADELLATYEASLEEQADLPLGDRTAPLKREQVRSEMSGDSFGAAVRKFRKTVEDLADQGVTMSIDGKKLETVN
jgi:uncharacterized protein (UPF0335 family)